MLLPATDEGDVGFVDGATAGAEGEPARALGRRPASGGPGPHGQPGRAQAVGVEQVIAAVDSRGGQVVIHGWKTQLPLSSLDAIRALEPYCGEFLYTHVDAEGLMRGTDRDAILAVRNATARRVTAAGGITTQQEIDDLDSLGVDSVVGMALYTGTLKLDDPLSNP